MLHPLQRVLDPWSLTERSVFVGATGSHFASTVSIERLRCLNLPLAHRLHSVSFLQPLHRVRLPDALSAVNHLLRDFRSGDVSTIDPTLLDLLHGLAATVGSRRAFQVISGYRSPATNETLRQSSSGVASGSLRLSGQAIDIQLADVPLATLRDAARSMRSGGVGYYAASDFVHLDTGRVRSW